MARPQRRPVSRSQIGEQHLTWLQALPGDGPFLTVPVLVEAFPTGLELTTPERAAVFKHAYADYRTATSSQQENARQAFITATVRDVLDWRGHYDPSETTTSRFTHTTAAFKVTTTPAFALWPDDPADLHDLTNVEPTMLGFVWPTDVALNRRMLDGWAATPIDRAAAALRHHNVPLGVVTNARSWVIVWAPRGSATGWVLFDTHAMLDDRQLLDAFTSLLARRRQLAVADTKTLNALLNRALDSQEELTENLSAEVRKAVEMLVDAIGAADQDTEGHALSGVDADHVYQGAVTIVMRLVFLLAAEERRLLPGDDDLWIANYGIAGLADRLIEAANAYGEDVLARQAEAFPQVLATSRIVHEGIRHQTLNIRGYGGSVFDPDRHPWLEGRQPDGPQKPVHVDDRTMLHILRGLTRWQGRRLAYRTLDVEQIGYVYEGLLDHTAVKADTTYLGLRGGKEPEVPLDVLEEQAARGQTHLRKWLKDTTGLTPANITRALDGSTTDVEQERLLLAACGNNQNLADSIRPFFPLLRTDERNNQPIVYLTGHWFVTKSEARSGSGSFYTPRFLAEEVVKHTLDGLVYAPGPRQTLDETEWRIITPDAILRLNVADIAMGSGAFLVAADRYLADRLIESVTTHSEAALTDPALNDLARIIRAVSSQDTGQHDGETDEATLTARRLVATRCLYGADINPMAVEMAKLSLWLATAAKDRPFGFLDHHLAVGDALLGLSDVRQIENVHPNPSVGARIHQTLVDRTAHIRSALEQAIGKRKAIEGMRVHDLRDVEQQQALLADADRELSDLGLLADAIAAEAFAAAQTGNKSLDDKMLSLGTDGGLLLADDTSTDEQDTIRDRFRASVQRMQAGTPDGGFERHPVQWIVRFPEVFLSGGGFDGIVGNPPYLGGQRITGALGTDYRNNLTHRLADGRTGSADLVVYFVLNAARLAKGRVGLLTTNTVAQGDSREVGLDHLTAQTEWRIVRANRSEKWPSKSANLQYSAVYLDLHANPDSPAVLDRTPVKKIGPDLRIASRVTGTPNRLHASQGIAFQGSVVLGMGFTLTPDEAEEMIAADPRNADVIFPYLNGQDLNSSPTQQASRQIINFFDWTVERAATYPLPFRRVEQFVKPERTRLRPNGRPAVAQNAFDYWWRYERRRPNLYGAISDLDEVIVIAQVSNTLQPARVPARQVLAMMLVVFASDSSGLLGLLASGVHGEWVRKYASSMRTDVRYTPSDVFETFPIPLSGFESLDQVGKRLEDARASISSSRSIGLTEMYNLVNDGHVADADVMVLREAHVALDRAVLAAYGWSDLEPDHCFYNTEQGVRFTMNPPVTAEVLDRLLELNQERYAVEVAAGLHGRQANRGRTATSRKKAAGGDSDAVLFE